MARAPTGVKGAGNPAIIDATAPITAKAAEIPKKRDGVSVVSACSKSSPR